MKFNYEFRKFFLFCLMLFFICIWQISLYGDIPSNSNDRYSDIDDPELSRLQKLSLEELVNVKVTTATRTKMTLREAPATMYVITDKQIRARGYRTLSDALHDVPGFDFQHTYGIFPDLIHQRGLVGNNQHLLLYVNGVLDNNISENAVLGGSVRFPLYNVKRIEIVSGPVSSIYGANAFNGVINIITKDGIDDPGYELQFLWGTWMDQAYMGGGGVISARKSFNIGGLDIMYSVSGYYYRAQGPDFRNVSDYNVPAGKGYFWSPFYNNSHEDTFNITARLELGNLRIQTVNWQYLQGDGTFANGTHQIDTDEGAFGGSGWDFRNNSLAIGYLWEINEMINLDSEITARYSALLDSSHESYPNTTGPGAYSDPNDVTLQNNYKRHDSSYEIEEQVQIFPNDDFLATFGFEFINSSVPKGYGKSQRFDLYNFGLYTLVLYRPADYISLSAGYRYDVNTGYGSSHTPRAGIVLTPGDATVKFLFSTGFRAPTAWELYNETLQRYANPDLKPERLIAGEIGLGYKFFDVLNLAATGFYNHISDLILEVQVQTVPTPMNQNRNVGDADVAGMEIQGDLRVLDQLSMFLNYTYSYGVYSNLSSVVDASPITVHGGRNIPNIAPHKLNLGITWYIFNGLSAHLRMNYVHERKTIATNMINSAPGYALLHCNIRWENIIIDGLFLQVTVRNILDSDAFDPGIRTATGEYYPTMHPLEGRNVWITLGCRI